MSLSVRLRADGGHPHRYERSERRKTSSAAAPWMESSGAICISATAALKDDQTEVGAAPPAWSRLAT